MLILRNFKERSRHAISVTRQGKDRAIEVGCPVILQSLQRDIAGSPCQNCAMQRDPRMNIDNGDVPTRTLELVYECTRG